MNFKVVIPARFASIRLPGKPLLDIAGKPMVIRVVEKAVETGAEVIVATDDERILQVVTAHGYQALMTSADHASGTDRIAEVAQALGWHEREIVVNVQGDEPLIEPELITEVAENLAQHPEAAMASACHPIQDQLAMINPNIVKVVMDKDGHALYFSRAPIPYPRDALANKQPLHHILPAHRHIGIYAYRTSFLKAYATLMPADIERIESLEQLRVLWHGYKISMLVTAHAPAAGVDTQEDLDAVRAHFMTSL